MSDQLELFGNTSTSVQTNSVFEIPGLRYVPEFLPPVEQDLALREIDAATWRMDLKRRVQHYGYLYDYKARRVDPSMYLGPLPTFALAMAQRLVSSGFFDSLPDQLIVNEYLPGQGITAHVDCEPCFGETVAMISLAWPYEIVFTNSKTDELRSLLLATGSALVISGEARHAWLHEIKFRKTDRGIPRKRRVSLTFRTVILPKDHEERDTDR